MVAIEHELHDDCPTQPAELEREVVNVSYVHRIGRFSLKLLNIGMSYTGFEEVEGRDIVSRLGCAVVIGPMMKVGELIDHGIHSR